MGCTGSKLSFREKSAFSDYVIYVRTGDSKGAGTDSNVTITLRDINDQCTQPQSLDVFFRNDFERGKTDVFTLKKMPKLGELKEVEVEFSESGIGSDWFLEKIVVEHKHRNQSFYFPCHRWIRHSKSFIISQFDSCLPQNEPHPKQRAKELSEKRQIYEYIENAPGLPMQIKNLPDEEMFSDDFQWDLMKRKAGLLIEKVWVSIISSFQDFDSLDDVRDMFTKFPSLEEPPYIDQWTDDVRFGDQRLNSCNPKLLRLCQKLPTNFAVDDAKVEPFLQGLNLPFAISSKRIFIVDLEILEDISTVSECILCKPLALFFLTKEKTLIPIAIQLFQRPSTDNPVFYPSDDSYLWLLVKMWYNNADASYHQACVHLGSTHILMEGVNICTQRHLSPSHPIYKLLAPHFLYLLAINFRGLQTLISPGGWVDKTMTIGRNGMIGLMAKKYSRFELNVDADLVADLKRRGIDDSEILPGYHYRDDALLIYNAITTYVNKMLLLFYPRQDDIVNDTELQAWGAELVAPKTSGLGLKGVPGNGRFRTRDQLLEIFRIIIYTCSVEHAAVNFNQYDAYAFPPNYPAFLKGVPPKNKDSKTEADIVRHLPSKSQMLDSMVITKILSVRSTKALGDFEVIYHYEPKVLNVVHEFQKDLKNVSKKIQQRGKNRQCDYSILDPITVPNSISI